MGLNIVLSVVAGVVAKIRQPQSMEIELGLSNSFLWCFLNGCRLE